MPDLSDRRRSNRVQITVTADDIARGHREGCQNCPVAFALWRVALDAVDMVVMRDDVKFYRCGGGRNPIRKFPREVTRFIDDFDAGRPVAPFSFSLSIPEYLR